MDSSRINNQLRNLESVFKTIHEKWQTGRPVDKELSALFRQNKQYGSKDRRLISNAIFGYYRWYGWLKDLPSDDLSMALILGYLLDGNDLDDRIEYWAELASHKGKRVDPCLFRKADVLEKKMALFSEAISPVSMEDLNPEMAREWDTKRIKAFQTRPPIWLRLEKPDPHTFISFLTSKNINYRFHNRNSKVLEILAPFNIHESVDFRNGWVEIQDLSSQAIGLICQPQTGSVWWDVCSGSGGKALHLAALMSGSGLIYATDINSGMIREMNRRINKNERWKNIYPLSWDGLQTPDFDRLFDGVLVDAPCSCSGTWRRNPELRWRISKEQVLEYARVQLNLLRLCSPSVRDNGVLVYATCSLFSEENEKVTELFLDLHPEFKTVQIENPFTGEISKKGLTIAPPETDGNGMYVVKMEKTSSTSESR